MTDADARPHRWDALVIGEALIDIVESPDAHTEHVGGSPANVALGLGRSGAGVALLTRIGEDEYGKRITAYLEESSVKILPESIIDAPTSTALARVGADGQAAYVFDVSWALPPLKVPAATVLHTGSIAAFLEPGASGIREILRRTTADEVTFDPNIRPALLGERSRVVVAFEEIAALASVVKLSDEDARWLYPTASVDDIIDRVRGVGPRLVALTEGGDGAILATATDRVRIAAPRVDVVDTIGAGDTFMASLITSLTDTGSAELDRASLQRIGADAVRAAAITVSRAGADIPWRAEL